MKIRTYTFSSRLSLQILGIVGVLYVIVFLIVAISSHRIIADEATSSAQLRLNASITSIEQALQTVEISAICAAGVVGEHLDDTNYLYAMTQQMVEKNPYVYGSTIAFRPDYYPDKHLYAPYSMRNPVTNELSTFQMASDKYDYLTMEWFAGAFNNKASQWSEPYYDEGGGNMMMSTYSVPLFDDKGEVIAVFTADIWLKWIADEVDKIKPYPNSHVSLVSHKGKYINAYYDSKENFANNDVYKMAEASGNNSIRRLTDSMMKGERGVLQFHHKGKVSFAVYGPLKNGWMLSITCDYRDVLYRTTQMHKVLLVVGLIGLLAVFAICYIRIRRLTQPLTDLSVSAMNMAKGNFHATIADVDTADEMRRLHDSFVYLQQSVNDYIVELKETTSANQRMESELTIARKLQMSMLSSDFPHGEVLDEAGTLIRAYGLYALLCPAKEVGGDLYDFKVLDDKLYFAVGDVSGKGVPAALFMAVTRAAFRFLTSMNLPVRQMVGSINNVLSENNTYNMFCTLFAGCIDLKTGQMKFCNAGHNPIIVMPPDGEPYYLKAKPNLATGLFTDFPYEEEEMHLERGMRLLLYTDGVSEAETVTKDQFGEDRLLEWACKMQHQSPSTDLTESVSEEEVLVNNLYATVKQFTLDNEPNDDITILMLSV